MSDEATTGAAIPAGPTKTEILNGGADVAVTYKTGQTETVKIRLVEVGEYPALFKIIDNEPAALEFYCQKLSGWAVTLTRESHEQLVQEAERVNGDFFWRWVDRKVSRAQRMVPQGLLGAAVEAAMQQSSTSSLKSPARPR